MAEAAGIEELFENQLRLEGDSESESEWDEIELDSNLGDGEEIAELPSPPLASSSRILVPAKTRTSMSKRARLILPCSRILRHMKKRDTSKRVQRGKLWNIFPRLIESSCNFQKISAAAVHLAASLEYLVFEVLELAGNEANFARKRRINSRHILLSIRHDIELNEMMKDVIIPDGGVVEKVIKLLIWMS